MVGTKSGELLLYDVAASTLLSTYKAHTGPVWGIHVRPDGRGMVSGSADKDVKFWEFDLREEGEGERVVSRLGKETVVRPFVLHGAHYLGNVVQDKAASNGSRADSQDDG